MSGDAGNARRRDPNGSVARPGPLWAAPLALSCSGSQEGMALCREVRAAQVPREGLLLLFSLTAFYFEKGLNLAILICGRTSIKGDAQVLICFCEKGFARKQFSLGCRLGRFASASL